MPNLWSIALSLGKRFGLQFLAIGACIGLFVWWTNKQQAEGEQRANAKFEELKKQNEDNRKKVEDLINKGIVTITLATADRKMQVQIVQQESHSVLQREIEKHPEMKDPEKGITQEMFDAINRTKAEANK